MAAEFEELSGRSYGLLDAYRLDDADRAIVALGSSAGTVKDVVDDLRDEGERVGLLKVVSFRPFPAEAVAALLADVGTVIVLDRADSPGGAAPLRAEVAAALYGGGASFAATSTASAGATCIQRTSGRSSPGEAQRYVGLRGEPCPV